MEATLDTPNEPAKVSANDRLTFTTFLAAAFHAIILFGITFTLHDTYKAPPSLEVTLASHKSSTKPEEADFLAQMNQQGSGTLEEKQVLSTTELADYEDNVVREIDPMPMNSAPQAQRQNQPKLITSNAPSTNKTFINPDLEQTPTKQSAESALTMLQRSMEIASMEAMLDMQRRTHAKRPRKRTLTAASTQEARDALYMDNWRRKIETIGNTHYPTEARRKKIYGQLRLMVAVTATGKVDEIVILKSSGYKILDDAAIRIVRLAEPFAPFPDEIAADTDILQIIRTWDFGKDDILSSY